MTTHTTPAAEAHRLIPGGYAGYVAPDDVNPERVAELDEALGQMEALVDLLKKWHDDAHPGAWLTCQEQPCHAVKILLHGIGGGW